MRTIHLLFLFVLTFPGFLHAQDSTQPKRHRIIASVGNGQAIFWRSQYAKTPSFQPHFGVRYLYSPRKKWFEVGAASDLTFNYLNKSYDVPFRRQIGNIGVIVRLNGRLAKWLSLFIEPGLCLAYTRKVEYPRVYTSPGNLETLNVRSDLLSAGPRLGIGADIRISERVFLEIGSPQLIFTVLTFRDTDPREPLKGFVLPATVGIGYKF